MKILKALWPLLCVAALLSILSPFLRSDEMNKLTFFTFSAPVEIPGGKVLPAGAYAFKVVDTNGTRDIVRILNKNQTRVYATVLTIPDYRATPSDKAIIKFSETRSGGPEAIKLWFYPGDTAGWEFVYPKNRAAELAKASRQPVPSMPQEMSSAINEQAKPEPASQPSGGTAANSSTQPANPAMMNIPLKAEEANGQEVELSLEFPTQPPSNGASQQTGQQH